MIRFRFVEDHRGVYDVKRMCALVEVPRSSFYDWASGPTAAAPWRATVSHGRGKSPPGDPLWRAVAPSNVARPGLFPRDVDTVTAPWPLGRRPRRRSP